MSNFNLDEILNTFDEQFRQLGDQIKEQTGKWKEGARDKTYQYIRKWIKIIPQLQKEGFELTSFELGLSISPHVEWEMKAPWIQVTPERIDEYLEREDLSQPLRMVYKTMRTTYRFHSGLESTPPENVFLKINVQLPPEVRVILGEPEVQS